MSKTGSGLVNLNVDELVAVDIETTDLAATNAAIGNLAVLDINAEDVNVAGGVNPQFKSTASGQTLEMGVASANGNYFPTVMAGDSCIKASNDLFVGTELDSLRLVGTVRVDNLLVNNNPLKYATGSWIPEFTYVSAGAVTPPVATITYQTRQGAFTRIGNTCTVFFDVGFSTVGGDAYVDGAKFCAIGNLPIRIGTSNSINWSSSAPLNIGSYPNGMIGGVAPAFIGIPTYGGGYEAKAMEVGSPVELSLKTYVNVPLGTWTADGLHLLMYADCTVFNLGLEPPAFVEALSTSNLPFSNFNLVNNLTTYSGCRFAGSVTYYVDD
jgi:hypothetical protein